MAHPKLKFQLVWTWLMIFNVDRTISGLNVTSRLSSSSLTELEDLTISDTVTVTLKSCCFDDYLENASESHVCENESVVNVSWDLLKLYRVPNLNITGVLEVNTVGVDSNKVRANCENPVSLTIPAWEDPENFSSKGYFAAFDPDGHLQYDKYVYSPDDFCVQRSTPQDITVIACSYSSHCTKAVVVDDKPTSPLSPAAACISRCCNYGEVWDISGPKFRCTNSGDLKWEPEIYPQLKSDEGLGPLSSISGKPWIISTHPKDLVRSSCKDISFTFQSPHEQIHADEDLRKRIGKRPFKVLQDGTVWMKIRKLEWVQLHPGEYCIDGFQYGEGNFSGASMDALLFECKVLQTQEDIKGEERQRAFSLGFGIILIFCLIFLVMTAVVYVLLWSKHNIHGWTVFCYIISLLITYLLLGTSHFASISLEREVEKDGSMGIVTFCGIIGILCHFSFLSTFSWSTVLNFDLWCTFRNLRPTSGKSSGRKKFVLYCLFALAVPSAIVTTGLVLDFKYRNDVFSDVITPEYGKSVCYVEPRKGRFVFVILPIAALLGINLLLFCNTAYSLYKVKKATQFASSNSTKDETGNQTFRLILKLLLINGTIWIAEIISWYIQTDYEQVGIASFILDVVNVLQAVGIFFLFVFKNDILESLRRTYPCLEGPVNLAFKLKTFAGSNHSRDQGATNTTSRESNSQSRTSKTIESNLPVTKF